MNSPNTSIYYMKSLNIDVTVSSSFFNSINELILSFEYLIEKNISIKIKYKIL